MNNIRTLNINGINPAQLESSSLDKVIVKCKENIAKGLEIEYSDIIQIISSLVKTDKIDECKRFIINLLSNLKSFPEKHKDIINHLETILKNIDYIEKNSVNKTTKEMNIGEFKFKASSINRLRFQGINNVGQFLKRVNPNYPKTSPVGIGKDYKVKLEESFNHLGIEERKVDIIPAFIYKNKNSKKIKTLKINEVLSLSTKSLNVLEYLNIKTVGELMNLSSIDIIETCLSHNTYKRYSYMKMIEEIENNLKSLGVSGLKLAKIFYLQKTQSE